LAISSVTEFELLRGSNGKQSVYWEKLLSSFIIYPFDSEAARISCELDKKLKKKRKKIDIPDLFIAAIAVSNNLTLATLNRQHFERVVGLRLFDE